MKNIDCISYNDWEDFKTNIIKELCADQPFERGRFIFRGQSKSEWRLESSFDRVFGYLPDAERIGVAKRLCENFRNRSEGLDFPDMDLKSEIGVLAWGQHYGLPTRLLDWTESPYVAAFFAFADVIVANTTEGPVAIWILDVSNPMWNKEYGVEILKPPSSGNIRLRNQSGLFTLMRTRFKCLEDYVLSDPGPGETALRMATIPSHEAYKAISDLDIMGINYSNLFPGLNGYASDAQMRVAIELWSRHVSDS